MKLKYVYGIVAIIVIAILIIVSQSNDTTVTSGEEITSEKNIPDDDVHNNLGNSKVPGKENVSEEFRHRMEMLKKTVEENPKDTIKLKEYADLLAASHMHKESIEYYNKILSITPRRIDIIFSLSFVYYSLGQFSDALQQTEKILEIDSENSNALYNLGAINASAGNKADAKAIWQKLVDQHPDDDIGIKAFNSIKQLEEEKK